jgi:hypothetical protein
MLLAHAWGVVSAAKSTNMMGTLVNAALLSWVAVILLKEVL